MKNTAYIGFSSNLGNSLQIFDTACLKLVKYLSLEVLVRSKCYKTTPLGVKIPMPDFFNQVVKTKLKAARAEELLDVLLEVEAVMGRVRTPQNMGLNSGPLARTLDLDLLLFGSETQNLQKLTIPHARMFRRAFVLVPLMEIWDNNKDCLPLKTPEESRAYLKTCLAGLNYNVKGNYIFQEDD